MKRLFTVFASLLTQGAKEQKTKTMYVVMALVMMMLVPSATKGATTTIDFETPGTVAYNVAIGTSNYEINVQMGDTYSGITNGKVGNTINYRNKSSNWTTTDISRVAFNYNYNGVGSANTDGDGFYFRRDASNGVKQSGLYNSRWNQELAVLNLKPGDIVTITYGGGAESGDNANLRVLSDCVSNYSNGAYLTQVGKGQNTSVTLNISSIGDLKISANLGTFIKSISIQSNVAEYDISTSEDGKTSTFVFTKDGLLDNNDFTLPNLSASFGSISDFLVVSDLESHMYTSDGTETLVTDNNNNFQPKAGSFYAFRPTASGTIHVDGTLLNTQGGTPVIHVFVYNPNLGYNFNWDECAQGKYYRDTFYANEDISFTVEKGKTYYLCIDNGSGTGERANVFHLHSFSFTTTFYVKDLGVVINDVDNQGDYIALTEVDPAGGYTLQVKRCSSNINPAMTAFIQNGWLYMSKPVFVDDDPTYTGDPVDHAGTVIWDLVSDGGSAAIVVTFPYHASFDVTGDAKDPYRTYGHTWNFIDPRNSDSNIGNCLIRDGISSFSPGTTTGILSIGQYKDQSSQFRGEVEKREWTYSQRQTGQSGGFHDPYYANVWEMEGDNADMIWETEGLWFDTGTNLSCIYNEKDAYDQSLTNPVDFATLGTDPDRYVGLLPVTDGKKSSFTIPGLMPGDRVLIFMKSGEATGDNGIFLNITGAKDALGKPIVSTDLYKAGGTNWQHSRYEGCYHFIKDDTTDEGSEYGRITFDMKAGSMCKLLYIHIYQGQRINTNSIVSSATGDSGRLLFMNEKGAELGSDGQGSNMTLRFRGKGQQQKAKVLTCSGNLNYQLSIGKNHKQDVLDDHFTVTGAYYQSVGFTSKVGEIGMFRLREMDVEYSENYVADFSDRNFTVGYRDKVDSYPYTWDFTDIKGFSQAALTNEANNYPIAAAANDEYGDQWEISLFDSNGYMQLNSGFDPITNNQIFSPHKIGNGNQLWAGAGVIPEAKGLWFYSEDDEDDGYTTDYCSSLYNGCMQITTEGIRFANVPDDAGKRIAWWNYKMVVPDVPKDGAVYMRMKRDTSVPDDAVTYSEKDNADVPFLAARFKFASQTSKTDMVTGGEIMNGESYSFFQVPGTTDEWIVAVKNTTGAVNHLTFTLNGWIVKKVAISEDAKTLNKKGYASESRGRVIDHTLTSFFTGKPIKAYTAENYVASGDKGTIDLKEITKPMPAATDAGQTVGCVLYNSDNKDTENKDCGKIEVLNDGFHLFVPDMHDYTGDPNDAANMKTAELQSTSNNWMKSYNVGGSDNVIIAQNGNDGVRYVLSYQYYDHDKENQTLNDAEEEAFYRVAKGGALIKPNSAYISFPSTSQAKVSFLFEDDLFGPSQGITTGITETPQQNVKAEWYSLDGRKLNGAPTEKGLYIINGKKVLVK